MSSPTPSSIPSHAPGVAGERDGAAPRAAAGRPQALWRRARTGVLAALAVGAIAAVSLLAAQVAHDVTMRGAMLERHEASLRRLDTAAAELGGRVARFEYLPALLETTPAVVNLLRSPGDAALRDQANLALNRINAIAGADMVFVLDPGGTALAAGDWDQPVTPVGHNYAYRPYMQEALRGGRGRFFGIGATSGRPGYYLSYALRDAADRTLGVATVKVDLEPALRSWAGSPAELLVADGRGVVLLATQRAWAFRALRLLDERERAEIAAERSYDPNPQLLDWLPLADGPGGSQQVRVEHVEYLVTRRELATLGWQLRALEPLAPVRDAARNAAWMAGLATAVALLLATAGWQSRRAAMHKLAAQELLQQANDQLEARVAERTRQLSAANATLEAEVEQRKAAEASLRETQQELVHAAKLAVLGQMSAGLAHELNQPLAALRTLSDNAVVLMDKGRHDDTRGNLQRISQLVARLGELTRRLKAFAHKPVGETMPVAVAAAAANAQALLAERMRRKDVIFDLDVQPATLCVRVDPTLFEQVLVNLLANAVDAVASAPARCVALAAHDEDGRVVITVSDSGPGIAPAFAPQLFEPFATTKPPGAGLGLGLMISRRIVREFGGTLTAANAEAGGAVFRIELPRCTESPERAAEATSA